MTVKLANFFCTSASAAPPPPPTSPIGSTYNFYGGAASCQQQQQQHHHHAPFNHHKQIQKQQQHQHQQQQHQMKYNPYSDDDDNMSVYSTAASIMTSRDHPFNNSQRPLLPERTAKPATQLLLNKKKLNAHHQQTASSQSQKLKSSYISSYVQQQKRDSAKGLHGFNDFSILSQQYTKHLQSPHIGYPYGSPPSPTATSNDFLFDSTATATTTTTPTTSSEATTTNDTGYSSSMGFGLGNEVTTSSSSAVLMSSSLNPKTPTTTTQSTKPRYANISNFNATRGYNTAATTTHDYVNTKQHQQHNNHKQQYQHQHQQQQSRFEDDFCSRRNADFLRSTNEVGGPFIFGVPPEKQSDLHRMPGSHGGRGFVDVINDESCATTDDAFLAHPGKATMQSNSDTSSSSNDSSAKKGVKFLLRKRKTKKQQKQLKDKPIKSDHSEIPTIKCVVVGDGAVGKTNLILRYLENRFIDEHVPTASDIYNADVTVNDSPVHLTVCDTAGQDTLDPLRELCYPDSDVFLLCFSVAKPETFHAIKTKWAPKFAKTKAALILVGTQSDLRTNQNTLNKLKTNGGSPISYDDAWDLATTIGAKYIETSSATQDKVKEVFDTAIWEGLVPTTLPPTPPLWKKLLCLA